MPRKTVVLRQLLHDANQAIEKSSRSAVRHVNEAINWADLHAVEAEFVINQDDVKFYRVRIEEASPNCPKLCEFVRQELIRADWPETTEVITEW